MSYEARSDYDKSLAGSVKKTDVSFDAHGPQYWAVTTGNAQFVEIHVRACQDQSLQSRMRAGFCTTARYAASSTLHAAVILAADQVYVVNHAVRFILVKILTASPQAPGDGKRRSRVNAGPVAARERWRTCRKPDCSCMRVE